MRTRIIQEDQDLALLQDDPEQVVRLDGVQKVYGEGAGAVVALAGVTMGFSSGSFTAVMGPSGSGKSTFLHVAAGLDRPTQGTIHLAGINIAIPQQVLETMYGNFAADRIQSIEADLELATFNPPLLIDRPAGRPVAE